MTMEQIQYAIKFIRWLYQHDIPLCVVGTTGGEAVLHPHFWTEYMPILQSLKEAVDKSVRFELHTNASIPIEYEQRTKYNKFFSNIFVGHDMCHREYAPLNKLYLQDYTDIGEQISITQNDWLTSNEIHAIYIRKKGRAAESIINGRLEQLPVKDHPKMECSWYNDKNGSDCLHFVFTPEHINHCGEKGHPLTESRRIFTVGNFSEGQFHSYDMDFDKLCHAALDYGMKYSGSNCSQKCVGVFCKLIK